MRRTLPSPAKPAVTKENASTAPIAIFFMNPPGSREAEIGFSPSDPMLKEGRISHFHLN
jgi:hypothetical protein